MLQWSAVRTLENGIKSLVYWTESKSVSVCVQGKQVSVHAAEGPYQLLGFPNSQEVQKCSFSCCRTEACHLWVHVTCPFFWHLIFSVWRRRDLYTANVMNWAASAEHHVICQHLSAHMSTNSSKMTRAALEWERLSRVQQIIFMQMTKRHPVIPFWDSVT